MAPVVASEIRRIMTEETKGPGSEQKIRAEFERFLMFDDTTKKPGDMNIGLWVGRIGYSVDQATDLLNSLGLNQYSKKLYKEFSDRISALSSEAQKVVRSYPNTTITWIEAQASAKRAEQLQRSATDTVTETATTTVPARVDNTIPETEQRYTKRGVYIGATATTLLGAATAYGSLIGDLGAAIAAGVFTVISAFLTLGWKLGNNVGRDQIEKLMGKAESMAQDKDNIFALVAAMEFSHVASQRAEKVGYGTKAMKERETALWNTTIPIAREIGPLQCNMLIGSAEKLLANGNVQDAVARANDAVYIFDSLWPRKAEGVKDNDVSYLKIRIRGFFDHQEVVEYIREEDIKAENAKQAAIAAKRLHDQEEARRREAEYNNMVWQQREQARLYPGATQPFSDYDSRGNPKFGTTAWAWAWKYDRRQVK